MSRGIIMKIIKDYVDHKSTHLIMSDMMEHIIKKSNCDYGFIGETRHTVDGEEYTRFHSVYGFPIDSPYMERFNLAKFIDFIQPGTLHADVYTEKKVIICKDLESHRKGKPMPPGHPHMVNFAIFPLLVHNNIIGVVGLSGKNAIMNSEWEELVKYELPIVEAVMMLIIEKQAIEMHKINFLANISHELRTPLNGIISMTRMLTDTTLDQQQKELLEIVVHCNLQLLEIVNDVVDYTKISSGKLRLNNKPFSLKKCMNMVVKTLKHKITKDVELILNYYTDIDIVVGDEIRVTQIVLNLLNNSIKFTRRGTITITIETTETNNSHIIIKFTVADTGIGIAKNNLKYIFDTFNQVTSYLSSDCGVGLGLPITKYLVTALGGTIHVDSEKNKGTTMTYTIKLNNFINKRSTEELKRRFQGNNILVVSDDHNKKKKIFHWALSLGIKPMMCTIGEMHMYLLDSDVFSFMAIVIYIDKDVTDMDIAKLKLNKHSCPIAAICQENISSRLDTIDSIEHVYSPDDIENSLMTFANLVYDTSPKTTTQLSSNVETEVLTEAKAEVLALSLPEGEKTDDLNILIAEDNRENQKVISILLNRMGYYNITMTSDGLEFYMELQKKQYDVALVDLKMPIMDGISAVKKFKEKTPDLNKDIIVVAVTASMSESIRDDCYKAGMNGYITKPIDYEELKSTLDAIVRKKYLNVIR